MKSNYRKIGEFIREVDNRNSDLKVTELRGLSMTKEFRESTSNIVGTDMSVYKVMHKWQFACDFMSPIRVSKLPVVLKMDEKPNLVSPAYPVFEVIDSNKLDPEYLMMWFRRSEFDRYATFKCDSAIRGGYNWEELCDTDIPVPHIDKQRELVKEYNTIVNRINLNNQLIQKLEETAQAIYMQWFVDFEFPDENRQPYKSSGGEMEWCEELGKEVPKGWVMGKLSDLTHIIMGQSPDGETYNETGIGVPLVNGPVEFGEYFTLKKKWTTEPTKLSKDGDLIICVRGSTTGRFVKSDGICCLGRGVCSFRAKISQILVDQLYKFLMYELLSLTTGSTFPNWDGQTLSNFPILIPTKNVQADFEVTTIKILKYKYVSSTEKMKAQEILSLLLSKVTTIEN